MKEAAAPATDQAHDGERDLCGPTEVRTKATCEGTQNKRVDFRGNVSFQLATGARRWYIIRCDLAPDDTLTIESVVAALKERPKGTALAVAGDLNTALDDPENDRKGM